MNQRRLIFFAIFGLYHIFIFVFAMYVESRKDLAELLNLYDQVKLFKYGALLGLVLFAIDMIWSIAEGRRTKREYEALRHENNTLKAKVYDLQQTPKTESVQASSSGTK